jgi:hypothetical protein
MGYTLGGLAIAGDYSGRFEELLTSIRPGSYEALGDVSLSDACMPQFTGIAAGSHAGRTLVLHQFWFLDCSYDGSTTNPLDARLAELSKETPVLCFVFDETSMSFGFAYFEDGACVRARRTEPSGVRTDYGDPLPAEAAFEPDDPDDSERIWELTESLLAIRLDRLIFEDDATLTRFAGR